MATTELYFPRYKDSAVYFMYWQVTTHHPNVYNGPSMFSIDKGLPSKLELISQLFTVIPQLFTVVPHLFTVIQMIIPFCTSLKIYPPEKNFNW